MSEKRVQATARVRLTIDVPVPDTWGDGCDVAQINRQARGAAEHITRRVVEVREARPGGEPCVRRETELGVLLAHGKARIVNSEVTFILVESER